MKTVFSYFEHNITIAQLDFIDAIKTVLECWEQGQAVTDIYDIERDEAEEEDFYDDVDETNYDPYLGCDFYDFGGCEEW